MSDNKQQLYVALYAVDGKYYREIEFEDYKRVPFGEIGWSVHPAVFGIINEEPIIFEKPQTSDWATVYAIALFATETGFDILNIMSIDPIEAKAGNAVVIERGGIFIPIKINEVNRAAVASYVIH